MYLLQIPVGEVSCPTKYFEEASSINFRRSVKYGFVLATGTLEYVLQKLGIAHFLIFSQAGKRLTAYYTAPKERGALMGG